MQKKIFAQRLISCYVLGSLAHGGFAPLVSDVDIALIIQDPIIQKDTVDITQIIDNVKSTNLLLANRLSIFWGSPLSLEKKIL